MNNEQAKFILQAYRPGGRDAGDATFGEALQQAIQANMGCGVIIDKISDKRFKFTAPHYVAIAAIPQDVYLYFYYKCTLVAPEVPLADLWTWRPVDDLALPAAIKKLVK